MTVFMFINDVRTMNMLHAVYPRLMEFIVPDILELTLKDSKLKYNIK